MRITVHEVLASFIFAFYTPGDIFLQTEMEAKIK